MLLSTSSAASGQATPADVQPTPEDALKALNGVFGRHAGERSSHAKGLCATGRFSASSEGRSFASSPLFAGAEVPVTARFSIGGGNPRASDKGRSVRGLGVRFHLPEAQRLDLVMISAPVFFAATPRQFVEFLKVRTADPVTGQKDAAKIEAFNRANPNVLPHLDHVSRTSPPASYATTPYFSTHAFLFDTPEAEQRAARWTVRPSGGFQGLTKEQEETFPDDFLEQELRHRLAEGPARWDVLLVVAEDGDPIDDPTAVWPEERRQVKVGELIVDRLTERGAADDCKAFLFDPNNLPVGIAATDDPILAFRSPTYALSLARRSR